MSKPSGILKKILKILLWVIACIFFLLVTAALLIRLPSVQTKVIHYATSVITGKTHTVVTIKNIGITLAGAIYINELYIEDEQKDTLLFAGNIKVRLDLPALIKSDIHFQSVSLTDVTGKVSNTATDSILNYNFLLEAFSDTTSAKSAPNEGKPAGKKGSFAIDNVHLKNIQLVYDDKYHGMFAAALLDQLELKVNKLDFDSMKYDIANLKVNGLSAEVNITRELNASEEDSAIPPVLKSGLTDLKNVRFRYQNFPAGQEANAMIGSMQIKNGSIDLNESNVSLDEFELKGSSVAYAGNSALTADTTVARGTAWKAKAGKIRLTNNNFFYDDRAKPVLEHGFDAAHLLLKNVNVAADDLYYSTDRSSINIASCSASGSNGFVLKNLKSNFSMDRNGISTGNLVITTGASAVNAMVRLNYDSMESARRHPGSIKVNAVISRTQIAATDVIYFVPAMASQPYLSNLEDAQVSASVHGTIAALTGEKLIVTTGKHTRITSDFMIQGLPDAANAWFYFPDLKIATSANDVTKILQGKLPDAIRLPADITAQIFFKGRMSDFKAKAALQSDMGALAVDASMKNENYDAGISINDFNAGKLLKDEKMFGPVTLTASIKGSGLDTNTLDASVKVHASDIYINRYSYKELTVDGRIKKQQFEGNAGLNDSNIVFGFAGLVNLAEGNEQYRFNFDLKGADLKKLHFTEDDIRIGMKAMADLKGRDMNSINGKAGITQLIIAKHGEKYLLDSILFASVNEKGKSSLALQSAVVGIDYEGSFAPGMLVQEMRNYLNRYFQFDSVPTKPSAAPQNFTFEITLHNHPVISDVFLPSLTEFEPGPVKGSFNSEKNELIIEAAINRLTYDSVTLSGLSFNINSNAKSLDYKLTCADISNPLIRLHEFSFEGRAGDNKATAAVTCLDDKKDKLLALSLDAVKTESYYSIHIDPSEAIIAKKQWNIADDNSIAIGSSGFRVHNLVLQSNEERIAVNSVHDRFNDELSIKLNSLKLHDLADIVKKEVTLVGGTVNGEIILKPVRNTYGFTADATVTNLAIREIAAGNMELKAYNTSGEEFVAAIQLTGNGNDVKVNGTYVPLDSTGKMNLDISINSLAMTTVEAFSMGTLTRGDGYATGAMTLSGTTDAPVLNGSLRLKDAYIKPVIMNNRLYFADEKISVDEKGIYMNSFTIRDETGHDAVVDGQVLFTSFADYRFNLTANTKDFMLFNTTVKDNKDYYGTMIIDGRVSIKGDMNLPVVTANMKLKKGSNFTFSVPEEKLTTDKGEGVVLFVDSLKFHPIITRNEETEKQKGAIKGFDIRATLEVDREATLRLLPDPSTTDSLVVKGDAALSFSLDPSGKMSLTGTYNLVDGSYIVSFQSLVKKKFKIEEGSTITWNGDVLDATLNIKAVYLVRTSPVDLVADQLSGLSEADKSSYRMRLPFLVYLRLNGPLMTPEISFEIDLPPSDKGALGGTVNAKLALLNEDESALNKQVFALLVLGRFVQENPLESEAGVGIESIARTSVSKFLTHQLNRLGERALPGVELSLDVQSYDDYSSGQAQGRTEVEIGLEKQLFNERVTVQVGGTVDVEGERAKQNNASDITGDVTVEYKLTEDGRYRLKGFRHNEYEGALEGQLVETGAGIVYTRDFNKWKNFLRLTKREKMQQAEEND